MPNFKKYNYSQDAMVVVNFEQQTRPNTFEFTVSHLIDHLFRFKTSSSGRQPILSWEEISIDRSMD